MSWVSPFYTSAMLFLATIAKYLAKRGIPFLLNLLAHPEIIGCEKTKEN